jgi:endonuclease YncB( thermonuclease family)
MYFLDEPMALSAWKTLSVSTLSVSIVKYLFAFALLLGVLHAETLSGKVINVADGDTITILYSYHKQLKIRLGGIDAPEGALALQDLPSISETTLRISLASAHPVPGSL